MARPTRVTASGWGKFRRYGIRPAKSILSSAADIAGDWTFYLRVANSYPSEYDNFEIPLLAFNIVSTVMGLLLLISLYQNYKCQCNSTSKGGVAKCANTLLGLEILLEDIPQFVMTVLVSAKLGGFDGYGVFNITTSGFNFALNLLDMIEVPQDDAMQFPQDDEDGRGDIAVVTD